jgi:hypothetical protein
MALRPSIVVVLAGALTSLGASFRTQNFVVEAPTAQIAQQAGQYAEKYRKQKALEWLGQEMPDWQKPCPLKLKVTMGGSGGATSFVFDQGRILDMNMEIEGRLDRLLASVLPHEVTHTVFAFYFRTPVPRWADEGGSVLSEDDEERTRHDVLVRQILNTPGRAIPLERLFALKDYPRDVMVLYAEGFSVTNFLVAKNGRQAFLAFIAQGMRGDWDAAVRTHYRYRSVRDLEQAWLQNLRDTKRGPATLASAGGRAAPTSPASRVVVRQSVPPAYPMLGAPRPVARAAAPDKDDVPAKSPLPVSNAPSAAPTTFASPVSAPPSDRSGFSVAPPPVRIGYPR